MGTADEGAAAKLPSRSRPEVEPVFLALPRRPADSESASEAGEAWLERLHVIETDCGPKVERSLLLDLLNRSTGFAQSSLDPVEARNDQNPLASLNAYKHRLQAIRCEYVSAHLRAETLEARLAESRSAIQQLERDIEFLRFTLDQMLASRAWKLLETCSQWRRWASQLVGRILGSAGPGVPPPSAQ
jgi:hypothetical protein